MMLDDSARDCVRTKDGKYIVIDTCWVFDRMCYETMVFPADSEGHVLDWDDLDVDFAFDKESADRNHSEMINKWSDKVIDMVL